MIEQALYLIPVPLSDVAVNQVLPTLPIEAVSHIKYYIVENVRSARRFLKHCDPSIDIDALQFVELNRHTPATEVEQMLQPLVEGNAMGVISEAGCPAVADPGADVVAIAQRRGLKVKPLVGPSSILMGLMGSGFNGQSFAFHGYLPIDKGERQRVLKQMQQRIMHEHQTQIFIETPYRNNSLLDELIHTLPGTLRLCVASDITGEKERIITRTIAQWGQSKWDYHKIPTIFLLYK